MHCSTTQSLGTCTGAARRHQNTIQNVVGGHAGLLCQIESNNCMSLHSMADVRCQMPQPAPCTYTAAQPNTTELCSYKHTDMLARTICLASTYHATMCSGLALHGFSHPFPAFVQVAPITYAILCQTLCQLRHRECCQPSSFSCWHQAAVDALWGKRAIRTASTSQCLDSAGDSYDYCCWQYY